MTPTASRYLSTCAHNRNWEPVFATARTPEEYRLYSSSYLAEIEKLNAEVLAYLKRHPSEPAPSEAA
jgi:hypothetical protein